MNHTSFSSATQEAATTATSNPELVKRAQAGDVTALEELFQRHRPLVYRVAYRLCRGNTADAEDTAQNAVSKGYQHLATFRGSSQFSTWLTQIVINECLMQLRRRGRGPVWIRLDEMPSLNGEKPVQLADGSDDAEERYSRREFREILEQCTADLQDIYRIAFVLHDVDGLPNQEIAAQLGVSVGAIKSRVLRARRQVRRCLREKFCRKGHCYWPGAGVGSRWRIRPRGAERACSL